MRLSVVSFLVVLTLFFATPVNGAELDDAVAANDIARVRALISAGANVNEMGQQGTPLNLAVLKDTPGIANLLIDAGADVEGIVDLGHNGVHPLHAAAFNGKPRMAALLIERGAMVDSRDSDGVTPLMLAAEKGYTEVAEVLLKAGADVKAEDTRDGASALLYAAGAGQLEIARLLLSNGADINTRTGRGGETPLWGAVMDYQVGMVQFLLEAGADPNIADRTGATPIMNPHGPKVHQLLLKHGAKQ